MKHRQGFLYLLLFYLLVAGGLFLFSYTQVDLSLTLSQASIVQMVQKAFQHVGFYERPLATGIYCSLIGLLFILYGITVMLASKRHLIQSQLWKLVTGICGILLFSYPAALSYDIFNYVFTAKTILVYGKNPYELLPLQLQGIDPMLSFMRWTHLASAYTPLWIGFTLPSYLLGFGSLLLTLWMMKALTLIFYFLCIWLIGKILEKIVPSLSVVGMVIFALNPLVIIEVLLGAHNDIAMMAFALAAFYLSQQEKPVAAFFLFALSVATKLVTAALAPVSILPWKRTAALGFMSLALAAVLLRREFLPWYFLWVLPFVALFPEKKILLILSTGISLGLLLRYTPVLYFGDYNGPVLQIEFYVMVIPVVVSVLSSMFFCLWRGR